MTEELKRLEREKVRLQAEIERASAEPEPVRLHPKLAEVYTRKVARLGESLRVPESRAEAVAALRKLIDKIVLTPSADGSCTEVRLVGDLATLLHFAVVSSGSTKLVAGAGFEPATFRL
jgi:hypothetical protein